jgi:hypothetical protein
MTRQTASTNRTETRERQEENPRKRRSRLGQHRSVLEAETREGYHRLWVNDYPEGHLQLALNSGYMFTKAGNDAEQELRSHDLGSMRSEIVGTKPDNSVMRGYLMEIKQEWHDEDMAENLKHAQDIDDQSRGGTAGDDGNEHGSENRYSPDGGIKYDT